MRMVDDKLADEFFINLLKTYEFIRFAYKNNTIKGKRVRAALILFWIECENKDQIKSIGLFLKLNSYGEDNGKLFKPDGLKSAQLLFAINHYITTYHKQPAITEKEINKMAMKKSA